MSMKIRRGDDMRRTFTIAACALIGFFNGVLAQTKQGTAAEARATLKKTVAALKVDKTKALI